MTETALQKTAITLCGSLRKDSINEPLRKHMSTKLREAGVAVTDLHLADFEMPIFNQDRTIKLSMRIGVNTGPVVRGDLGSRVVRRDYTVIGDTVNQANRYEAKCPHGGVLVSKSTYATLGGRAKVREIHGLELKGVKDPVTAYVVEELTE